MPKGTSRRGWSGIWILLLISFGTATAAAKHELAGKPFSDPTQRQTMPPGWQQQSIVYAERDRDADLVISLNQEFYQLMLPSIEEYATRHKLKIVVKKGTCGLSAGLISNKSGDIGAFCCPPATSDRLPGVHYHTVGIYPLSILVHPQNPLANVSLTDLRALFQGDILRWSELGWDQRPVQPIARMHCKKRPGHWRLLLDNQNLFGTNVREVGAIEDMFSLVARLPGAIGYEVMWSGHLQTGQVKALKIDGVESRDLSQLLAGNYPLYRVLSLTTWSGRRVESPHSKGLIDFVIRQIEERGEAEGIIPPSKLRAAGWRFSGAELVGEPR